MELHGKRYNSKQLRQRVGNMDQVAGIRLVQLDDGNERPTRAAIFTTGTGLEFTILLDRGMDIPSASYQGKAMGWRSTTGDVAPQYFEAEGIRWLRNYFGGLLTTCGLMNVGAPAEGSELSGDGLHGRIGNTPARDVKVTQEWQGQDYVLSLQGTMRETRLFGENLTLTRTVSTKLGSNSIHIHDVVENEGFRKYPFMLLYHCNIGWPAVDEGSRLLAPSAQVAPRDAEAQDGKEDYAKFHSPKSNYAEKCYYHDMKAKRDGTVTAAIVNDGFKRGDGFGVYVKYNKKQLPRFVQWKQLGQQDYVVGLEPCNCGVEGRSEDERYGLQQYLKPGERHEVNMEFGPITSKDEVKALEKECAAVKMKMVDSYTTFVKKQG